MSGRGKARLPSTGIRKPRAKDKRVGRKRYPRSNDNVPRDEMDATLMRAAWRDYDVHKIGGHFEWVPSEPETITPQDDAVLKVVRYSRKWSNKDALAYPEAVFDDPVAERLSLELDEELDRINPATKFGELSQQVTIAVDHLRSQAVVDRARAEHDAVPEVQLDDTEPQS